MAYIAIVVPTDADAEIGTTTSISPGGIPQRRFEPLGLHAGTLLLGPDRPRSTRIVISKGREVLSTWTTGPIAPASTAWTARCSAPGQVAPRWRTLVATSTPTPPWCR